MMVLHQRRAARRFDRRRQIGREAREARRQRALGRLMTMLWPDALSAVLREHNTRLRAFARG